MGEMKEHAMSCPRCGAALSVDGTCAPCLMRGMMQTNIASALDDENAGPYKLVAELGRGGMGVVFLAEQERPIRREVALKVIKMGMDTHEVLARFEQEKNMLSVMEHPGIARVLDAGVTSRGRPYFAMDLVEGQPLTRFCDTEMLDIRERLRLFLQVCSAVGHAHQKGVIHRDLKPANILARRTADGAEIKVIDFGIAKALGGETPGATLYTRPGEVLGTPDYMSPEQASGQTARTDTRTDVFALGAVLYELLTGLTPVRAQRLRHGESLDMRWLEKGRTLPPPSSVLVLMDREQTARCGHGRKERVPALKRQLRGDLDWITLKTLEAEPERRYASVEALANDIEDWLAGLPVSAAPPSKSYRFRKWVGRNRAFFAALILLTLAVTGGSIGSLVLADQARQAAREALAMKGEADARRKEAERARMDAENRQKQAEMSREESEAATEILLTSLTQAREDKSPFDVTIAEVLDHTSERLRQDTNLTLSRKLALFHTLGATYERHGRLELAEGLLDEAVRLRRIYQGARRKTALDAAILLGRVWHRLGLREEAATLHERCLRDARDFYNEGERIILDALDALGVSYYFLNDHEKAAEIQRENLRLRAKHFGENDLLTLCAMDDLAANLAFLGQMDEAVGLMEKALKALLANPPPNSHGRVPILSARLAATYNKLGRHEDALPLTELAIEKGLIAFGQYHPQVDFFFSVREVTFASLGRFDEAEETSLRYLEIVPEERMGDDQRWNMAVKLNRRADELERLGADAAANLLRARAEINLARIEKPELHETRRSVSVDHPARLKPGFPWRADLVQLRAGPLRVGQSLEEVAPMLKKHGFKRLLVGKTKRDLHGLGFTLEDEDFQDFIISFRADGTLLGLEIPAKDPRIQIYEFGEQPLKSMQDVSKTGTVTMSVKRNPGMMMRELQRGWYYLQFTYMPDEPQTLVKAAIVITRWPPPESARILTLEERMSILEAHGLHATITDKVLP